MRLLPGLLFVLVVSGCSSEAADTSGSVGSGGGGGAGGGGSSGGAAGMGGAPPTCDSIATLDMPGPEAIDFMPLGPVSSGEQILFNDWSAPDKLKSMQPDGGSVVEIFQAYRVWAMGVSRAADVIAFAAGDPEQEANWGITLGDAIQHTWIYRLADQSASLFAWGNINDECHHFGPGDCTLYVCRRHDFTAQNTFKGYRLAALDLPTGEPTFLTPDVTGELALHPQATPDGETLYYTHITVSGGDQQSDIMKTTLPDGAPELVRASAHRPLLSPDGRRYLFADSTQQSALYVSDLAGESAIRVADAAGTSARFSPDGTRVAYLLWDDAAVCSHVEVVAADGSMASTPERIRDCAVSGEFITQLAWVVVP